MLARTFTANSAVALVALALAGPAWGGTYPMRSCNVPGQAAAGTGPWAWENAQYSVSYNACARGGGFGLSFPSARSMPPDSLASLALQRPVSGAKSKIGIRQVRLGLTGRLASAGSALFIQARATHGTLQQTDIAGPSSSPQRFVWTSPQYPPNTLAFNLVLLCSSSTPQGCSPADSVPMEVSSSEVTLSESTPPSVSIAGGALFSGARAAGARPVIYEALDQESGLLQVEALLDGTVAGESSFASGSRCRYESWNACEEEANAALTVNTRAVPDGTYTFQLRVTDAAGNQRTVQATQPLIIANDITNTSGPSSGPGAPRQTQTRLAAYFTRGRRTYLVKTWRSQARIQGRLTDSADKGIANAKIMIEELPTAPSAQPVSRPSIQTSTTGRFVYVLPGRLSSRRVRFQYRAGLENGVAVAARDVRSRVRAATSLRLQLRGVRVRYSGRLTSGPIPRGGKLVAMQGRALGGTWQTFASRRTDSRGRFNGRYRLRVRRPGVRLQFRIVVPHERNYPYTTTYGTPVTRRVR